MYNATMWWTKLAQSCRVVSKGMISIPRAKINILNYGKRVVTMSPTKQNNDIFDQYARSSRSD